MMVAATKGPEKKKPKGGKEGAASKPRVDPFKGALVDAPDGLVHYFQDRLKKWTYHTDKAGAALLKGMFALAAPLISKVLDELPDGTEGEGKQIYARKPNLGANGVTWSQEDYGHRGLQAEYLRLKSVQRFTEGWCAFQRAYNPPAFTVIEVGSTCATTSYLAPSPSTVTVTVVSSVAPITTPKSLADRGARCSTAPSLNTPLKNVPAVALGKGSRCSG